MGDNRHSDGGRSCPGPVASGSSRRQHSAHLRRRQAGAIGDWICFPGMLALRQAQVPNGGDSDDTGILVLGLHTEARALAMSSASWPAERAISGRDGC